MSRIWCDNDGDEAILCAPGFVPSQISSLVAHWSGADADTNGGLPSVANRIVGSDVGALSQGTANDVPQKKVTRNGIGAIWTDGGSGTDDLSATNDAAMQSTDEAYFLFHSALGPSADGTSRLFASFGSTEARLDITYDVTGQRWAISVGNAAGTTGVVLQRFAYSRNTYSLGAAIEVLWRSAEEDEEDRLQVWADAERVTRTTTGGDNPSALLEGDATAVWLGSRNSANTGSHYIAHAYVGSAIPTDAQRAQLRAYQRPDFAWANSIVIGGNSIMAHFGNEHDEGLGYLIQEELGTDTYGVHVSARDGATTVQQAGEFANGVNHLFRSGGTNIVVFMEVGNHLLAGATEAEAQTEVEDMAAAVKALGWMFFVCTTMPRTVGVQSWTTEMQTAVDNINAAWRLDSSFADGLIDFAADAGLSDPDDLADGRHPTPAQVVIMKNLVMAAIQALL